MGFVDTLLDAQTQVQNADLACVLDPRDLTTLPAVWIRLDGLAGATMGADYSKALVTVFCIVKPVDTQRDLEALEPLLEQVAAIIPPMSDPRHVALAGLPQAGTPCPAISYTHDLLI